MRRAGDKLLADKQHAELLEPYEQRKAAAEAYMRAVRPGLHVAGGPLLDPQARAMACAASGHSARALAQGLSSQRCLPRPRA